VCIIYLLGGCQAKSSQTERHKVIELVDDGYKMRFRHIQVRSTGIRACGNKDVAHNRNTHQRLFTMTITE
jgi:hypothetical protein